MMMSLIRFLPGFAPDFLQALGVNLTVAAHAMSVGLPIGVVLGVAQLPAPPSSDPGAGRPMPLALTRWIRRGGASLAGLTTALLRAAPAFVVMYVLLHATPARWGIGPEAAVALALASYAAAYVADTLQPAALDWRLGGTAGAQLFLTGLVRCFFVMVLSSGFGAAVGVVEATAVTLRALEQLPTTADRLGLMACVVLVFITLRQGVNLGVAALRRWIPARAPRLGA